MVAFRDPHGLRPLALGVLDRPGARTARGCGAGATASPASRARSTSSARSSCATSSRARWSRSARTGLREPHAWRPGGRRAFCVFEYIYFARPDSRMNDQVLQVARGRMGEILWREAPVEADLVIAVPDSGNPAARGPRARGGPAPGRRLRQEPLRRAHVHPARPGAAQARPAAEVQPAARGDRRQAAGGRRRLDRARQHHAPDRADAARRGRRRDPHAHLRAADQAPLPLRHRHVHARGDDRPRAHAPRRSPPSWAATRCTTSRWQGVYEAVGATRATHCDACFTGEYPLAGSDGAKGKYSLEEGAAARAAASALVRA